MVSKWCVGFGFGSVLGCCRMLKKRWRVRERGRSAASVIHSLNHRPGRQPKSNVLCISPPPSLVYRIKGQVQAQAQGGLYQIRGRP